MAWALQSIESEQYVTGLHGFKEYMHHTEKKIGNIFNDGLLTCLCKLL